MTATAFQWSCLQSPMRFRRINHVPPKSLNKLHAPLPHFCWTAAHSTRRPNVAEWRERSGPQIISCPLSSHHVHAQCLLAARPFFTRICAPQCLHILSRGRPVGGVDEQTTIRRADPYSSGVCSGAPGAAPSASSGCAAGPRRTDPVLLAPDVRRATQLCSGG